jgi:Bacterial regulatory proteins, luxR family
MPDDADQVMDGIEATRLITGASAVTGASAASMPRVLILTTFGLSNTELAATLHVSMPTVKTHVSRMLTKLGARDRTQLVVFAYEAGLA